MVFGEENVYILILWKDNGVLGQGRILYYINYEKPGSHENMSEKLIAGNRTLNIKQK